MLHAFVKSARALTLKGNLSFGLLAILFATLTGPFETRITLGPTMLVIYWTGIILASMFIAAFVQEFSRPATRDEPSWKSILIDTAGMVVLYAPLAYGWTWALVLPLDGTLMAFHWFAMNVALISAIIFAARKIIMARIRFDTFETSESGAMPAHRPVPVSMPMPVSGRSEQSVRPRLYRRIDAADPGPILRIEAMDHFVTVVTHQAEYQLRQRFCDAVEEMDGVAGLITHRSHWVARAAVDEVERENGRLFLRLSGGTRVPVSRKHRPVLEDAGLI